MRVAFVTHYTKLYGANRSLLHLIDGLRPYGVKAFVLAPSRGEVTSELDHRHVPYVVAPFKRWMATSRLKAPARLGLNLAVLPFLAAKVHRWNVDLVHTNSSVTPIGALVAEVLGRPHTWHVRELGQLHYRMKHDWGRAVFRMGLNRAAAVVAVSKAVRRHVLCDVAAPCHVVYNGVVSEAKLERLRREDEQPASSSDVYTFALVGALHPAKGQEQAMRAAARLARAGGRVRLLLAGDALGGYEQHLRRARAALELQDVVTFLGYVPDPFAVYRRADAVLMCSSHEAMGRVTAEAMAALRPVIGFDQDGTAELIDDGQDGLLYDGSTEHLATCMQRFMDNPAWAASLGRTGWEKARREFTDEVYARRMYDVMREALSDSGSPE